jgi:hypothetical protein
LYEDNKTLYEDKKFSMVIKKYYYTDKKSPGEGVNFL